MYSFIRNTEFSRVTSHGLKWGNKQTKPKRSIGLSGVQFGLQIDITQFSYKNYSIKESKERDSTIVDAVDRVQWLMCSHRDIFACFTDRFSKLGSEIVLRRALMIDEN